METTCTLCQHDKVCKFKHEFTTICRELPRATYSTGIDTVAEIGNCKFVKVSAICEYFTEVLVQSKRDPFSMSKGDNKIL